MVTLFVWMSSDPTSATVTRGTQEMDFIAQVLSMNGNACMFSSSVFTWVLSKKKICDQQPENLRLNSNPLSLSINNA